MRIAYIISMATSGVNHWMYREMDILSRNGIVIFGFATKWTQGPHMPKPEWHIRRPNRLRSLAVQPFAFLANPVNYVRLLLVASKMRTVPEFLLAAEFSLDMRRQKVDHIHCHFGDRKLFTGYFCKQMLELPLTVTVHAYEILCNPNPAMFKLAAAACNEIITISEFNKKEIMKLFGIPEEKIRVIHCHGNMSDERMRTSIKLLIVAEFREKKGHDILFKALKKLDRQDLTLWIVGKGKIDVRTMADEIGVSPQAIFLGEVGRGTLDILYDACDIFVLPSRTAANGDREGIPVTIMEAMSRCKPVISTRHVGIPELLPDVLVDENDVDGLAEAIALLADNPKLRKELGERNYQIIQEGYSETEILKLKEVFGRKDGADCDV